MAGLNLPIRCQIIPCLEVFLAYLLAYTYGQVPSSTSLRRTQGGSGGVGTYIPHMSVNLVSRVPGNLPKQAGNPTELGIVRCNMVTCLICLGYLGT